MDPPPSPKKAQRDQLNLKILQRHQKNGARVERILDSASYVVCYRWENGGWKKRGIEGSMFLFQRTPTPTSPSPFGLFVLNRNGLENLSEDLTPELGERLEVKGEYIIFASGDDDDAIHGIWVFEPEQRERIGAMVQKLCQQAGILAASSSSSNGATAQHLDSRPESTPHRIPFGTPISLDVLFNSMSLPPSSSISSAPTPPPFASQTVQQHNGKLQGGDDRPNNALPTGAALLYAIFGNAAQAQSSTSSAHSITGAAKSHQGATAQIVRTQQIELYSTPPNPGPSSSASSVQHPASPPPQSQPPPPDANGLLSLLGLPVRASSADAEGSQQSAASQKAPVQSQVRSEIQPQVKVKSTPAPPVPEDSRPPVPPMPTLSANPKEEPPSIAAPPAVDEGPLSTKVALDVLDESVAKSSVTPDGAGMEVLGRRQFVKEVLALLYTDNTFVDDLYGRYLERVDPSRGRSMTNGV